MRGLFLAICCKNPPLSFRDTNTIYRLDFFFMCTKTEKREGFEIKVHFLAFNFLKNIFIAPIEGVFLGWFQTVDSEPKGWAKQILSHIVGRLPKPVCGYVQSYQSSANKKEPHKSRKGPEWLHNPKVQSGSRCMTPDQSSWKLGRERREGAEGELLGTLFSGWNQTTHIQTERRSKVQFKIGFFVQPVAFPLQEVWLKGGQQSQRKRTKLKNPNRTKQNKIDI